MLTATLRLGYPIYKNKTLSVVTTEVLREVLEEEKKNESDRIYQAVPLTEAWLVVIGFEKKVNPINKVESYMHHTGLKVGRGKGGFYLNYTLKEVMSSSYSISYSPSLEFVHEVLDAILLFKKHVVTLIPEDLELIKQRLLQAEPVGEK
jgi:hypothetical protein